VAVVVEHGGGGSSTAAPIARDVMLQALFEGTPPLEAYPEKDWDTIRERQEQIDRFDERPDTGERDQA
jgi:penicillin-binding protein 2